MNEKGNIEKDPYLMAEILRKQYESAFSTPDPELNIDKVQDFFRDIEKEKGDEREEEEEGEEREEEGEGHKDKEGEQEQEEIRGDELNQHREEGVSAHVPEQTSLPREGTEPQLKDVHFDCMDIADSIDALSLGGGPGPDGISPILLKKSKLTVLLMLYIIFYSSIQNSEKARAILLKFQ